MTITQLDQLNTDNFADFSNIIPENHRAFNSAVIAFLSTMPKMKVLTLDSIVSVNSNHSIDTGLESNETITGAVCMLECKVANNNFSVRDTITAPTPYPADSGRTYAQGIGLQYTNVDNSSIKVMINDDVMVMTPYRENTGASADNIDIGPTIQNWKLKVFVTYI